LLYRALIYREGQLALLAISENLGIGYRHHSLGVVLIQYIARTNYSQVGHTGIPAICPLCINRITDEPLYTLTGALHVIDAELQPLHRGIADDIRH
jgi:hypothetical protein